MKTVKINYSGEEIENILDDALKVSTDAVTDYDTLREISDSLVSGYTYLEEQINTSTQTRDIDTVVKYRACPIVNNDEFIQCGGNGDNLVAINEIGAISYSHDGGLSWTVSRVGDSSTTATRIAYGNGTFVISCYSGYVLYSTNEGVSWTKIKAYSSPIYGGYDSYQWLDVVYSQDFGKFFMITDGGPPNEHLLSSVDGINWTSLNINGSFKTIVAAKNKIIAFTNGGYYIVSTDGITFGSNITWSGPTSSNFGVATDGIDTIIVIGDITSYTQVSISNDNGTTWTYIKIGEIIQYSNISYGAGYYVITDEYGGMFKSTNGVKWYPINYTNSVYSYNPKHSCFSGTKFVFCTLSNDSNREIGIMTIDANEKNVFEKIYDDINRVDTNYKLEVVSREIPTNFLSKGIKGSVVLDDVNSFLYICVETNRWVKIAANNF